MASKIARLTDTATTDAATAGLESQMYGVEVDVLDIIAKRLGKVTKATDYSDIARMVAEDMPKIGRLLEQAGISSAEFVEMLFDEMAELNDEWAAEYFEARGMTQAKVTEDAALSAALKSGKFTVENGIASLCNSSVAMIVDANGRAMPIAEAYRSTLNDVVRAMVGGEATKEDAVQRAARALSESGIQVQYKSGKKRELYSAVRQSVVDGYGETMQALRDEQGRKFGANGVEITAHSQCAPDHQKIQGKQYTNDEFEELNSKLERPIGKYNCRHSTFPVIVGVSSKTYSQDELDEMITKSNKKVSYTSLSGEKKSCTVYEFTQVQRQMETRIRKVRTEARLMRSAGQDAAKLDELADRLTDSYKAMSRQARVRTRLERTEI